jgi:hypothetical protein
MNDFDERVRAAGERVRQRAGTISRDISPKLPRGGEATTGGVDSHARQWSLAAAVLVAAAGVVAVGLVATSGADETQVPAVDPAPTVAGDDDASAASSTTEATPDSTLPIVPATSATSTSVPSSEPPATAVPAGFERPIIDPDVCAPRAAWESGPITTDNFTLFARPSELPVPIQIIGDTDAGESKPFALVQRYFGEPDNYAGSASETVQINGTPVRVGAYPSGNGEALWVLADGSEAYLRSRGLGRDEILRIVSGLDPRANDAGIPGFDYTPHPSDVGTLELVAEQMNTTISFASGVGSQCDVAATGFTYRLAVFDGDPVARFASIIDRPPPLDVGLIGDRVAMISGPTDAAAPSIADIIEADEAFWFDLRSRASFEDASFAGWPYLPSSEIRSGDAEPLFPPTGIAAEFVQPIT